MFTSKELARWSSKPTAGCLEGMKHLAGYISGHMKVVYKFKWRKPESKRRLVVKVDTDFAGCLVTRRSTSGGCLMLNGCLVKGWAKTQATVAQSTCEAEFIGANVGGKRH